MLINEVKRCTHTHTHTHEKEIKYRLREKANHGVDGLVPWLTLLPSNTYGHRRQREGERDIEGERQIKNKNEFT